jgi:hypothetical protein
MPRIVLSLEEWQAVAHELAASHTFTAPPGLTERVRELLTQAHDGWAEQAIALELDEGSAETVRAVTACSREQTRMRGNGRPLSPRPTTSSAITSAAHEAAGGAARRIGP